MARDEYPHYISRVRGIPDDYPHQYGYSGSYADSDTFAMTVSVGVYTVVPKANGKGKKRGTVLKRFRAPAGKHTDAFLAAERYISTLSKIGDSN